MCIASRDIKLPGAGKRCRRITKIMYMCVRSTYEADNSYAKVERAGRTTPHTQSCARLRSLWTKATPQNRYFSIPTNDYLFEALISHTARLCTL